MIRTTFRASLPAILAMGVLLNSCGKKTAIVSFDPVTNFSPTGNVLELPMDMNVPVQDGITLPSLRQSPTGKFIFKATLRNTSDKAQALLYKVFYQNESYKFQEKLADSDSLNPESGQNFYGSWANARDGFHSTPILEPGDEIEVVDSFVIQGNPRDETRYFGPAPIHTTADSALVASTVKAIYRNPTWFATIKEKAVKERLTIEQQAMRDALWVLANPPLEGRVNNRWQRNPRVGEYSFLVTVSNQETVSQLPTWIVDISRKGPDSLFVNPYWYFLYGPGKSNPQISTQLSPVRLRTSAKLELANGVHVPCLSHPEGLCGMDHYGPHCGDSEEQFRMAHVSQFFHHLPQGWALNNVPVIFDVTSDDYTPEVFRNFVEQYPKEGRKSTQVAVSREACTTVWWDDQAKVIRMRTPASDSSLRKENEGLKTRIGLTYGKWRAKVKFPNMINKHNMWTGLTHAVWLLYQSEKEWNYRRECVPGGYLQQNAPDPRTAPRVPYFHYSEIDIEIAKESRHWPQPSYTQRPELYKKDDPASNRDVIVSCTNWDLACKSGDEFVNNVFPWESPGGKPYLMHRWDEWTPAMTLKSAYPHDSLFGQYAWYEIDWQPERIIWRVGLDLEHMVEVGYMDQTITDVPDNQMIMVISQEFHYAKWWPLAPQSQDDIPYPGVDLMTEIAEIRID